jgi:hypothetical protein
MKRRLFLRAVLPYEVNVEAATRTIVIKGSGQGTTADTLQLIADTVAVFREHTGFNLLYNSSALQIASNPNDMMQVAQALFEQSGALIGRMAIVVPESREHLARMFAALAHPHGVTADVFTHESDARRWLGIER